MERCFACGGELPPQARFCSRCGAAQEEMARNDEPTRISDLYAERLPSTPAPQAAMLDMATPAPADGPTTPASYPQSMPAMALRPQSMPSLTATPPPPPPPYNWPTASRVPPAGTATAGSARTWLLALMAAIVVGGAVAGVLIYVLARPQPVTSVHSLYTLGNTPAGSTGTSLQFTGQHFAGNSAISFLLDGHSAPGAPDVSSDSQGNVSATLPVTAAWPQGRHLLTARDAGGQSSQVGVAIEVVAQGVAHTPGPFGAPPDDASFQVSMQFRGTYSQGGGSFSGSDTEIVSGRPDPAGGRVCQPEDNGLPHQYTNHTLDTGLPETQTIVYSCSGTYRAGALNFTETLLSDTVQLTDQGAQITCHLLHPGVDERLTGTYSAQGKFSGTLTYPGIPRANFSCTSGPFSSFYFFLYSGSGTWTGTITVQ
jgi:hypothetical protein